MNSLSGEFIDKWVLPFYMTTDTDEFAASMKPLLRDLTPDVYAMLLAEANWRPRIVAGYFAAILLDHSLEEQLGRLLLRSDVCFAGTAYCLALARFNSETSIRFLRTYLDHYLQRPELFFDQGDAIGAISYLDHVNGTDLLAEYTAPWEGFVADKDEAWDLSRQEDGFRALIGAVDEIAAQVSEVQ